MTDIDLTQLFSKLENEKNCVCDKRQLGKGSLRKKMVGVLFFRTSLYTFPSFKFKHLDHRSMITEAW